MEFFFDVCWYRRNYHTRPYGGSGTTPDIAQSYITAVRNLFNQTKRARPDALVIGYSQASSAVGEWRYGLTDVEMLAADGFMDAWIDQSWSGAWQDVPARHTAGLGWTHQLGYILAHRAQIVGGNRKRPSSSTSALCKHYVLHDTFDSYEGWDTLDNVPWKLRWGIWSYNHAAFRSNDGALSPPDGQYISWANSWSETYVTGGAAAYLDRPLGLLTRANVGFLTSALNAAVESANNLEEVFGPTMVYNRPALDEIMRTSSTDNVYEWIDEQVGVLLKFAVPVLSVSRIEHGLAASSHQDGYIVQIPNENTSQTVVNEIINASIAGKPVGLLGRADRIHNDFLHGLLGTTIKEPPTIHPSIVGNASLFARVSAVGAQKNQIVSLSPYVVVTVDDAVGTTLMSINQTPIAVYATKQPSTVWAQINDWNGVAEDLSVSRLGTLGGFQAMAALLNAANQTVAVVSGVNATHPVSMSAWRSQGTVKILLGNLEGMYCGGNIEKPYSYSDGCSIDLANPSGGYAGGTHLDVVVSLNVAALGVSLNTNTNTGTNTNTNTNGHAQQCVWQLKDLDGVQHTRSTTQDVNGNLVFAISLSPREAHPFELTPSKSC